MTYRIKKIGNFRQRSKFYNIRRTYNGYSYQSKLEAKTAQELDFRLKAGELESWDRQVKIELVVNGEKICDYRIDFIATRIDGIKEYIECKGLEMLDWKLKWKLFNALYKDEIGKGEIEPVIIKT